MAGGMLGRYLAARDSAAARADHALVREVNVELERLGYRDEMAAAQVPAVVEERAEAEAQPARRPTVRR